MAHAAVVSLIHTLELIIESPRPLILYETRQLQNLQARLRSLLELLETSPNTSGVAFEPLSVKIRDKAHEAEDSIESLVYIYHGAWHSIISSCINLLSSLPLPGLFDWGMGLRYRQFWKFWPIDFVINDVIDIIREVNEFWDGPDSNLMASSFVEPSPSTPTALTNQQLVSFNDNKLIVGHEDEFKIIQDRLVRLVPKSRQVIPISGMGGIGKTTFARKLYKDPSVIAWFDVRAWVTIKQEFNVRKIEIVQELVDCLPKKVNNQKKENLRQNDQKEDKLADLTEELYKALYGRRYLIVLDDVWNTNVWDYFQRFFPDDGNCSRVILTTRDERVAAQAGGSHTSAHVMKLLSDDECWDLLRAEVFGKGHVCPCQFVAIGNVIASSCKGLPLAVIVIAGLLSKGNKTLNDWEYIAENLSSTVANDTDVGEILHLSYKHLPQHLKACFLYIGVFLECYKVPVSKIVRLWVAEGFVQQISDITMEQVAEEYIWDLVQRSLVSVGQRKDNGRIKTIFIHDLLRELCIREAQKENFIQVVNRDGECTLHGPKSPRRLSLDPNVFDDPLFECLITLSRPTDNPLMFENARINQVIADLKKPLISLCVRSLLYTGQTPIPPDTTFNFMFLRVLDMPDVQHLTFPLEILKLVHLRFLAFPYFAEIPESIVQLYNLETIIFTSLFKKSVGVPMPLPSAIWSLPKLRHLKFHMWYLRDFPCVLPGWRNVAFLRNLQSLSEIHASFCTIEVLNEVPNLKKLSIWIEQWDEAPIYINNLICLPHFEVLKCSVRTFRVHNFLPLQQYEFIPRIALPTGRKKITLAGCKIPWAEISVVGSLPNLETLKLKNDAFVGKSWTTTDDGFEQLSFLIIDMSSLVHWNVESVHVPYLRSLVLRSCFKLEEIPHDIAEIETLEMIEIDSCSASATNSAKQIMEELKNNGYESLRIYIS